MEDEEGGAKARVRVMAEKRLQSVTAINEIHIRFEGALTILNFVC